MQWNTSILITMSGWIMKSRLVSFHIKMNNVSKTDVRFSARIYEAELITGIHAARLPRIPGSSLVVADVDSVFQEYDYTYL